MNRIRGAVYGNTRTRLQLVVCGNSGHLWEGLIRLMVGSVLLSDRGFL